MRWERFFEDLEDQLDSEWEAERAALDSETERLRVARLALRERLTAMLAHPGGEVAIDLVDGTAWSGRIVAVGADWIAMELGTRHPGIVLMPLPSIVAVSLTREDVLTSARDATPGAALAQRMTFGFALRDLARRRAPVTVAVTGGRSFVGTLDRAGADHADLALHDVDAPRRASSVTGYRVVAFSAVAWVRTEVATPLP